MLKHRLEGRIRRGESMTGFEELKNAYEVIKDTYGYICTGVVPPDEDNNEGYSFIFDYQGFPVKIRFTYNFFDTPYPEVDKILFWTDDVCLEFSASCYFAITDLMMAFQKNRSDKEAMNEFIEYLNNEAKNNVEIY